MKKIILINALVWAALILVGSYLFKGAENWKYFFSISIISFAIINGLLSSKATIDKSCSLK